MLVVLQWWKTKKYRINYGSTNHVLLFGTHVVFDFLLFQISLIGPRAVISLLMMTLASLLLFFDCSLLDDYSFREQRCSLLAGVNDVIKACGHCESADINMLQLLLYGNKYLPLEANKLILNLTIKYISETERFG